MSSAYLRLSIFLPPILIPSCALSRPARTHLPRAGYQRAKVCSHSPLNLFQLTNPKPPYSTSSILFHGNYNRGFCLCFLPSCSASWLTRRFPMWPCRAWHAPFLGIHECNNLFFQLYLSLDLWAKLCPHLNKHTLKR